MLKMTKCQCYRFFLPKRLINSEVMELNDVLCVFDNFADISPIRKKAKKLRVNMARKSLLVYFPDAVKFDQFMQYIWCNRQTDIWSAG